MFFFICMISSNWFIIKHFKFIHKLNVFNHLASLNLLECSSTFEGCSLHPQLLLDLPVTVGIHQLVEVTELRRFEINWNFFVLKIKIFSQINNSGSGLLLMHFNNLDSSSNLCLWDQKCAATADLFSSLFSYMSHMFFSI